MKSSKVVDRDSKVVQKDKEKENLIKYFYHISTRKKWYDRRHEDEEAFSIP